MLYKKENVKQMRMIYISMTTFDKYLIKSLMRYIQSSKISISHSLAYAAFERTDIREIDLRSFSTILNVWTFGRRHTSTDCQSSGS